MYPQYRFEGFYEDSSIKRHIIQPDTHIQLVNNEIIVGRLHNNDDNKIVFVKGFYKDAKEIRPELKNTGLLFILEKEFSSEYEGFNDKNFATKTAWILQANSLALPSGTYMGSRMQLENEINYSYDSKEFIKNLTSAAQRVTKFPAELSVKLYNR